ncbi:hypothetical protein [Rhodococcus sp. NPDC057529]|uniref:hypothetical protein n=1 Tax=Rhodococcus sp. NPDC057529 TaxID=3346158 RepID=UPI00366F7578
MSIIVSAAFAAMVFLILRAVGPWLARIVGGLLVISAFAGIALGAGLLNQLITAMVGFVLWIVGHLVGAIRDGHWRSQLAHRIIAATALRRFDPEYRAQGRRPRRKGHAEECAVPANQPYGFPRAMTAIPGVLFLECAPSPEAQFPTLDAVPVDGDRTRWVATAPRSRRSSQKARSSASRTTGTAATRFVVRRIPGGRTAYRAWQLMR